jgi:hypothetical protein
MIQPTPRAPRTRLAAGARLALIGLLGLAPGWAAAQSGSPAARVIAISPDITIDLGSGIVAADQDAVTDDQLGLVVLENLGAIPLEADVIALGLEPNGDRLLAVDVTTELPGGVVVRPGDVVRTDGSGYTIAFDGEAAGLPRGVAVDAASRSATGNDLLLSFDVAVDLGGGLVAADEDVVVWDGGVFTAKVFDGAAAGLDPALDVDAAHDPGDGTLLLSFDTGGTIGGVSFRDEDVLRFDGSGWSLAFEGLAASDAWGPADLDALAVPEPETTAMLAVGVLGLMGAARMRRRSRRSVGAGLVV